MRSYHDHNYPTVIHLNEQNERNREAIRAHATSSTYFMAKAVIGFKDMVAGLHGDMGAWIDGPANRKLGLVPRDHLKTSMWTIANTVVRIVQNPNVRILLGNETATNAQHFLRRIEAIFERNSIFQWLFPELIPDFSKAKKWSESEMLVPRNEDYPESTVETIGVGGAVVSRHYKLIKLDDLVGKEASESPEVMRKVIDWYLYCESLLECPTDPIEVYGTRWTFHDLYAWIEKNEDVDVFLRDAEHGVGDLSLWPERFPMEQLARIKRKVGPLKFSCQYKNRPFDPEGGSFKEEKLRKFRLQDGTCVIDASETIPFDSLRTFMRIDPAISEKRGAARTGIVVDGCYKDGRVFLLEAWARRCSPFEMLEKMFEFQATYDCEAVGIEAIAYQRVLKPVIENEARRRNVWVNVVDLKPDTRERKANRIRGALDSYLDRGLIWIDPQRHGDFLEEYLQFPQGELVDLLDAFAYGPQMWGDAVDESESNEYPDYAYDMNRNAITGY